MSYYPKQMRFRVEDYVRTKAEENEVRFHLHMQNEPIVEGNTITIYHKGGALKATVVEPANVKIDVIGGPGKEFVTLGVNYPYTDKWVCKESGWGQVMLTSQEGGKEHRFVVEMEIFDREILGI